jgi:hypothetical protein
LFIGTEIVSNSHKQRQTVDNSFLMDDVALIPRDASLKKQESRIRAIRVCRREIAPMPKLVDDLREREEVSKNSLRVIFFLYLVGASLL